MESPSGRHPGERRLLDAVRRSPADPRTWPVRWHLGWCRACRMRIEEADAELVRLFHAHVAMFGDFDAGYELSRARLLNGICTVNAERESKRPWIGRRIGVLASVGMLAACVGVAVLVSLGRHEPALTATAVLADAAARQENSANDMQPGVLFQRVQVHDGDQKIEWLVYRDREGKRKARFQPPSGGESRLRERLATAGITRDDPLSVSSYRKWRNRLTGCTDNVVLSPSGLIVLRTSVAPDPQTAVQEEMLLLRKSDYHPVLRSVRFRDAETVEIAELDYRVLDWAQVQKGWFESAELAAVPAAPVAGHDVELVKTVSLDPAELNLAELRSRLILSTHDADTGEQIELTRTDEGIRVEGMTSTAERKRELESALESVPHVTAELVTPEERAAGEPGPSAPGRIKVIESASQPSPLLVYLQGQPGRADAYRQFSARLVDAGVRISQQCHALAALQNEFAPRMPLDAAALQVYESVAGDHVAKLKAALADQAVILRSLSSVALAELPRGSEAGATLGDLEVHSAKVQALTRELVAGESAQRRDALLILHELAAENSELAARLEAVRQNGGRP